MEEPTSIQTFAAYLAPVVAISALGIAAWQAYLARRKIRLDLFDKRFAAFAAIRRYIGTRLARGEVKLEDEVKYLEGVEHAPMLFMPNDAAIVEEVRRKVADLDRLEKTYPEHGEEERRAHGDKIIKAIGDLRDTFESLPSKFARYLEFRKP
jgi:hypothetical protein